MTNLKIHYAMRDGRNRKMTGRRQGKKTKSEKGEKEVKEEQIYKDTKM